MDSLIVAFIHENRIDSFQKLYVLLSLCQHPNWAGTSRHLANNLQIAHFPSVEKILSDLCDVGLVDGTRNRYKLCDDSRARSSLQSLIDAIKIAQSHQAFLAQDSRQQYSGTSGIRWN